MKIVTGNLLSLIKEMRAEPVGEPQLWVLEGAHDPPYKLAGSGFMNEEVTLADNTPATFVGINKMGFTTHEGTLVSDSFKPCRPIFGAGEGLTYLAHCNGIALESEVRKWDPKAKLMVVTKPKHPEAPDVAGILWNNLKDTFPAIALDDAKVQGSMCVIVIGSTCLAYKQA